MHEGREDEKPGVTGAAKRDKHGKFKRVRERREKKKRA
jgi:hypothetical protein